MSQPLAIQFKTKIQNVYNHDDSLAYRRINVPRIERKHCQNLQAFRTSKRFGYYANSDLFSGMLRGSVLSLGIVDFINADNAPGCVSIDETGFLAVVTITLPD